MVIGICAWLYSSCLLADRPSRITTRHIAEATKPPIYGIIGDACESDRECYPDNSACIDDACVCEEMYVPSRDGTRCEGTCEVSCCRDVVSYCFVVAGELY